MTIDKRPAIILFAAQLLRSINLEKDPANGTIGFLIPLLEHKSSVDVIERLESVPWIEERYWKQLLEARARTQDADEFRGSERLETVYSNILDLKGPNLRFESVFPFCRILVWKPQEDVIVHLLEALEANSHSSLFMSIAECAGAMLHSTRVTEAVLKTYAALSEDSAHQRINFLLHLSTYLDRFALKRETLCARISNFLIRRPFSERAALASQAEAVLPIYERSNFTNYMSAEENLLRCMRSALVSAKQKVWFNKLPWVIERSTESEIPFGIIEETLSQFAVHHVADACCGEVFAASSQVYGRDKMLDLVRRLIGELGFNAISGLLAGLSAAEDESSIVEAVKENFDFAKLKPAIRVSTSYLLRYAKKHDHSVAFWLRDQLDAFLKETPDPAMINSLYDVLKEIQATTSALGGLKT
eukprot:TRINITY_DN2625_c0_g1_i1.p1 TRINITY_DN2625_c0_g1~~TRINITY_DN2625_c0_g1_i1.p1  ORF type:complete len:417 (+),score=69.26 TRINITY_DN2625_c0_g1_i1:607-1857(+)